METKFVDFVINDDKYLPKSENVYIPAYDEEKMKAFEKELENFTI